MLHEEEFVETIRKHALQFRPQSFAERTHSVAQSWRGIMNDPLDQASDGIRNFAVLFFFSHDSDTAFQQLAINVTFYGIGGALAIFGKFTLEVSRLNQRHSDAK